MAQPAESTAKKRFGAELRAHRARQGWTQAQLGDKLGYSGSYISDVERGDCGVTDDFARRCDSSEVFDLPGTFLRLYEDLQRESFPTWFAPIVPIEREAGKITGYESISVPGLLQTPEYARTLIRARRPQDDEQTVESTVQARIDRQGILARPKPPLCWWVLAETVIRQLVGGTEVMGPQLDRMIKAAEAPGVVIQIFPFSAHDYTGTESLLHLYERPDVPMVAYTECVGGGRLIQDQAEVSDLATVIGALKASALPPRDSLSLMRDIRRELG
jgi:transcriptional regulator with XRE-family HTH domain